MPNNIFQINFMIFIIFFIWLSYKAGFLMLYNYITGFLIVLFISNFHLQEVDTKARILIFLLNLFLYTLLFCSSLFIYFDKENEKKNYFILTIISYLIIIMIKDTIFKFEDSFFSVFLPLALGFFPLYILKYYKKYYKE